MSKKPLSWQERTDKLNKKNRLKLLYEHLGKTVLEKGYLKGHINDPAIEGIIKEIESLSE